MRDRPLRGDEFTAAYVSDGSIPAGRLGEQTAVDRTLPTGPTPTAT